MMCLASQDSALKICKTDSSGETLLQPTGNSRLEKWVISVRYYVYNEMIKLVPMKVPVRKYSDVDWIRQAKNTELTCICTNVLFFSHTSTTVFTISCCKRKTHSVN